MKTVELASIDQSGGVASLTQGLPVAVKENCEATASLYRLAGYEVPWIGYVSLIDGRVVGGGAFKGPPRDNRVEIAYYTLQEFEGQGIATATARALIDIARRAAPAIVVTAQTLPAPNASNALLQKLGFTFQGSLDHPEDGEVWEWHLDPGLNRVPVG
jgi:ribosomal-protein-alanine N-acetyltransferase